MEAIRRSVGELAMKRNSTVQQRQLWKGSGEGGVLRGFPCPPLSPGSCRPEHKMPSVSRPPQEYGNLCEEIAGDVGAFSS